MSPRDCSESSAGESTNGESSSLESAGSGVGGSANYDADLLEAAKFELENVVELHEEWHLQSERDFQSIFRFNILVAGGFVSVLAIGNDLLNISDASNVLNMWTGLGGVFWVMSTLSAAFSYVGVWHLCSVEKIADVNEGVSEDREFSEDEVLSEHEIPEKGLFEKAPLAKVLSKADDRSEFYSRLLDYYVQTISHNRKEAAEFRYALFHLSLLLLLVAVVVFAIGVASAVRVGFGFVGPLVGCVFGLFGLALSTLVIHKLYRYRDRLKLKIRNVLAWH